MTCPNYSNVHVCSFRSLRDKKHPIHPSKFVVRLTDPCLLKHLTLCPALDSIEQSISIDQVTIFGHVATNGRCDVIQQWRQIRPKFDTWHTCGQRFASSRTYHRCGKALAATIRRRSARLTEMGKSPSLKLRLNGLASVADVKPYWLRSSN
jgi:hypothetical protein